ncbi:MAG: peptidoglycan-binding protein [Faecousia sp.]
MTVKQKQCLLAYLGYDTGGVDGIWGGEVPAGDFGFSG